VRERGEGREGGERERERKKEGQEVKEVEGGMGEKEG
jgi:hypothetical protein